MDYPTDSPLGSPDGDGHRRSLFGGDVGSSDAFAIHEPSSLFGALERAEPDGNATDPHSFWDKTLGAEPARDHPWARAAATPPSARV